MPELAKNLGFSQKVTDLKASGIRIFDNKVSKIPGIIKLTLGEPDMNTPEHVKEAAIRSIQNNDSHYAPQKGKLELRKAISNFLKKSINVDYDPESEIVVTVGATEAINATLFAITNPGDQIIIPTPVFSLYWPVATLADADFVLANTAEDNFILTPEHLEEIIAENPKAKAVVLNYPTNPTGVEYSKDDIKALAKVIAKHNLYVITDEIYSSLTYGIKHYSIATEIPERAIYISGVSKSHAMTGYRLGYVAGPKEIMEQISKVHGLMVTTTTDASQAAAIEALTNGLDDPENYRKVYQKRRDFVVKALNEVGMSTVKPQGAFYVFAKIPEKYGQDDMKFALDLAYKKKVGVTPGSAFGPGGEGYMRLSYASSDENLHTALNRIREFLEEEAN
ncbi:aminotransferase class I/II-fold pyridoxal phosphate-dependent enzyme [Lactobacillus hamsteri]|uniref:Aminotransferase n=1 Tax=Lactobacillus hamsteri DSM 5661 = JCM 6256 TaxID=1423754 RepID=A0A0R1YEB5_9LACO|nr:aminotransferase class I/II-fold pyridoxal phosphate-dependent enzyme [Lactobacillus hamsteri]KRM40690.1 aspartate transaminase [Lactobacillus hamsteri DSM 5661 = JCM 6256]